MVHQNLSVALWKLIRRIPGAELWRLKDAAAVGRPPSSEEGFNMACTRRKLLGALLCGAAASMVGLNGRAARAGTYYDSYGNVVVINTVTLVGPVTVYDAYGRPITIYPTNPAYVPGPRVYGPAGIRGQSRRVARRTSRRVSRRR